MKTLTINFTYSNEVVTNAVFYVDGLKFLKPFETKDFQQTGSYKIGDNYASEWSKVGDEMTLTVEYNTERKAKNAESIIWDYWDSQSNVELVDVIVVEETA